MTARVPDPARAAGHGGVGYLIDSLNAMTHGKPVARTVARLRVSGRDKYRVDYPSRPGRNNPKTIACDGEHRWHVFAAQTIVRVVEETGNAFADAAAVMPGAAGYAVRTATDVVGRTRGAVSAVRSFLDDLRGRSRS